MVEEPLAGGRTTAGVVRVGDTVRRPRGHRSEFASRALLVLREVGFQWSPEYLGVDGSGRDTLAFVPGETTDHPSQRDERSYAAVGALLRDLHERTRGTDIAAGGTCLVHGDAAPFNMVMHEGMPVMLIDWDSVHPGDPLEDVGYAGWTWCSQTEGHVPLADQADRLRRFRDGYDSGLDAAVVLAAVEAQQRAVIAGESSLLDDDSVGSARRRHAATAIAWAEADLDLLSQNRAVFADCLRITTSL